MSKQRYKALGLVGAVAVLAGCAAPSVKYVNVTEGMTADVADIYALNAAKVTITPPAPKPATPPADTAAAAKTKTTTTNDKAPLSASELTISVSVIADDKKRIGIDPTKNVWSSTKVNIEKVANTDRVASIGVETTDTAKTFITTIGGLLVQAVGAVGLVSDGCLYLPGQSATSFALPGSDSKEESGNVINVGTDENPSCIHIKYHAVPAEAIKFSSLPIGEKSEHYYYSACRDVDVTVSLGKDNSVTKQFRIPDSNWLQKVAFPYKGSIAMHSGCGVSVTTTGQANPMAPYEFATELLKQAEAIRKAGEGK